MRLGWLVTVFLLAGCSEVSTETAPEAPVSSTAPPSAGAASAAGSAGSEVADPGELPRSDPPRVAYVDGSVLRRPDGSSLRLSGRWSVTSITAYAGGFLVTDDRFFEGTVGMHRLDAAGRVLSSWASTGAPVVDRDGDLAWVSLVAPESGGTGQTLLHVDGSAGGAERTQRLRPTLFPVLTGWFDGDLVYRVWGRAGSFLTDVERPARRVPLAQELGVRSPDGRRWARLTRDGVEVRQSDGQLLDVVEHRGLTRTVLPTVVWEDERHLLTTLVRGRRMALVRVDIDTGRLSLATAWRSATSAGFAPLPAR